MLQVRWSWNDNDWVPDGASSRHIRWCASWSLSLQRHKLYTRSPLQDSRLFGPRPWKVLTTTYEQMGSWATQTLAKILWWRILWWRPGVAQVETANCIRHATMCVAFLSALVKRSWCILCGVNGSCFMMFPLLLSHAFHVCFRFMSLSCCQP